MKNYHFITVAEHNIGLLFNIFGIGIAGGIGSLIVVLLNCFSNNNTIGGIGFGFFIILVLPILVITNTLYSKYLQHKHPKKVLFLRLYQ